MIADFANADDWRTYATHPEHQRVIAELVRLTGGSVMRVD